MRSSISQPGVERETPRATSLRQVSYREIRRTLGSWAAAMIFRGCHDPPGVCVRNLILRALAYPTFFVASWRARSITWFRIRVLGHHKHYRVLTSPRNLDGVVSIVAVYPRCALHASTRRLIRALKEAGSRVVVVVNQSMDAEDFLQDLDGDADVIITRANIGRDFGAYQAGFQFLQNSSDLSRISRVALFNDSTWYGPNCDVMVQRLIHSDSPAAAFFVNLQYYAHLQSFGLSVSARVAFNPKMIRFWRRYYPSNVRRHAIHAGERRFSELAIQSCGSLEAVVDAERLERAINGRWEMLRPYEVASLWWWSVQQNPRSRFRGRVGASTDADVHASRAETQALVRRAFTADNVSHALGLPCARLLGTPLKLDLVRQGVCSLGDVAETLRDMGASREEQRDVLSMMSAVGSDVSSTGIRKTWRNLGLE